MARKVSSRQDKAAQTAPVGLSADQRAKGQAVCDLVSQGNTLNQACESARVDRVTIWKWRKLDAEFDAYYLRCWNMRLDFVADELLDIADDGRNDWQEVESARGRTFIKLNEEAVRRSQLRIETRLRILAVHRPEQYGKKVDVTTGGKAIELVAQWREALADDAPMNEPKVTRTH